MERKRVEFIIMLLCIRGDSIQMKFGFVRWYQHRCAEILSKVGIVDVSSTSSFNDVSAMNDAFYVPPDFLA
jgi:hypothetical protein